MKEVSALIDQFVSESLRVEAVFFGENKEAVAKGMFTVGLTGETGGKMVGRAEVFRVPSRVAARIQETHIHIICELVDRELFPEIYPQD